MISVNADGSGTGAEGKTAPGSAPLFDRILCFSGDV
jgi:hypothetical protein